MASCARPITAHPAMSRTLLRRMANSSQQPLPPPGGPAAGFTRPENAAVQFRALLVTLAIAIGGALLGLVGGLLWSAAAPQAVFQVQSPGVAYVVNPETTAFIAADGWFSLIAVVGGVIIGLAAYFGGVRRYGPLPTAGAWPGPPPPRSWPGGQAATSAWPRSAISSAAARPAPCCTSPWTSAPTARSRSGRWPPGPSSAASS